MKTRLACHLVRTWSALKDAPPAAHLATCADCRTHFAATATLETALRSRVPARSAAPANLESNILRAVRAAEAAPAPAASRSRRSPWPAIGLAGATAAAAAFAFLKLPQKAEPELAPESSAVVAANAADATALLSSVGQFSERLADKVIPNAGAVIASNPLQDEFSAVYADARSALDFLALNFLPRTTASSASIPPRGTG
jgi:hypothetical protein